MATERCDGDFHPEQHPVDELHARQHRLTGRAWWMLDQVHGTDRFDVNPHRSGWHESRPPADRTMAAVGDVISTAASDVDVAIWAADCAPIVLIGDDALVVAAHGGWRGLAAGVIDVALDAVAERGSTVVAAVLGPVIHPCCYEFGTTDLHRVAAGVHADPAQISGRTSAGTGALDVPAAVRAGLATRDVHLDVVGPCSGCDLRWYSHRVRNDLARHATVVSIEAVA